MNSQTDHFDSTFTGPMFLKTPTTNEKFQKKGVGIKLIQQYEKECKKLGHREIVLRSQLYAVPFYHACGYKKTTGIRNKDGLLVQPMKKQL